jgi:hypothetical protein
MLGVINADTPTSSVAYRLADVGVVHPAVAGRAQDHDVLRPETLRWRSLGQDDNSFLA